MSESFAELFENSAEQQNVKVGALLMGTVVSINREKAVINVGLKSEGFISLDQFKNPQGEIEIEEGDVVEVALDSIDDGLGHTLLSREKAKRIKLWQSLETAMNAKEVVTGIVTGSVKGGLTVDIGVVKAFLPGSLVDVRPVKDFSYLTGQEIEAIVIKMDEVRNNIVISRKAVMQEANSADREALLETLEEGKEIEVSLRTLLTTVHSLILAVLMVYYTLQIFLGRVLTTPLRSLLLATRSRLKFLTMIKRRCAYH